MSSVDDTPREKVNDPPNTDGKVTTEQEENKLPEFTLQNVINDIIYGINQLIFNPEFNKVIIPVLLAAESIAVKIIRGLVSCKFSTFL